MDDLGAVVLDGVGVVEPAVIGVPLLAVGDEGLGPRLRQVIAALHHLQLEIHALQLARLLLLACFEGTALHTLPTHTHTVTIL